MLLLLLFCISSGLTVLSGCGHVDIPVSIADGPLYFIKGDPAVESSFPDYAVEMHFLTSGQTQYDKASIDAITQGMVMMPLSFFDDFNKEISDLCGQVTCDMDTVAKFQSLVAHLHEQAFLIRPLAMK